MYLIFIPTTFSCKFHKCPTSGICPIQIKSCLQKRPSLLGIKKYLSGRVPEMGCAEIKEGNPIKVAFLLSDIYCSLVLLV